MRTRNIMIRLLIPKKIIRSRPIGHAMVSKIATPDPRVIICTGTSFFAFGGEVSKKIHIEFSAYGDIVTVHPNKYDGKMGEVECIHICDGKYYDKETTIVRYDLIRVAALSILCLLIAAWAR